MKVKVIKSTGSRFWYKSKIGKEFYVKNHPTNQEDYVVKRSPHLLILKQDCEVIEP